MWIEENLDLLLIVLAGVVALLLIWNIMLTIFLYRANKRVRIFTGTGEIADLEKVIANYTDAHKRLDKRVKENARNLKMLDERTSLYKGNVEIMRYNAFDQAGQNLSYSIAFLDENADGIVLSGIYAQAGSSTYAKPITAGKSDYKLSPEEHRVLDALLAKIKQA